MADGDFYSNEHDLHHIFGIENIIRWSDPDNSGVKDVGFIDYANQMAAAIIDGRLREGPYTPSFGIRGESDDIAAGTVEPLIVLLSSSMAGVILYDIRRSNDSENDDQIAQQRKNADMMIRQLMSGQLKLIQTRAGGATPFNVSPTGAVNSLAGAGSGSGSCLVGPAWEETWRRITCHL